ncbi:MAG: hypothetical protein JNM27_21380 [Leptospirales bacterium]|nr:hypothetical protein [Leptospirales bacterium]
MNFDPTNQSWLDLDKAITEFCSDSPRAKVLPVLFDLLERLSDTYSEVLWSVVHFAELSDDYEPFLLDSLRRKPTEFALVMLHRKLNAGQQTIRGESISSVVLELRSREHLPEAFQRLFS